MKPKQLNYDFSAEKNQTLVKERGVSFEDAIAAIGNGALLDVIDHPNMSRYPKQKIYVVAMDGYAYLVPYVKKDEKTVFLKTIIPSRKLTKKYSDQLEGLL